MAPLHRQYKTARTETRWHLLLKTWQMPIQTSASRGYVLLSGGTRGTHKSPKIVCWLADTVRGVFQTWKDTDHRRCKSRLVRNAAFFEQNVSYAFQLKSTCCVFWHITYHFKMKCLLKAPASFLTDVIFCFRLPYGRYKRR